MSTDFEQIKAKIDYLLSRDDIAFPPNVYWDWKTEGLREPLSDERLTPRERLLAVCDDLRMGQLWFYGADRRRKRLVDESETEWSGEHDWIIIGESALAETTAILLHAQTGEVAFYDADAWDWNLRDNFVFVKESLAAFVDEVALGLDYELLYYQNLEELAEVLGFEDDEFPGIEADPWYHLLREMRADLFGDAAVPRDRRQELLRRLEAAEDEE
ncbi:hypothetical protein [Glycomyces tritici]|uniref:SMI1/KNR4 family protein n=1 Tax=Glycomyces tritici TaxID=2665176 RepID=A0ABT7YR63_9ACTN|nr:hypothetical protein [Glycomyces tritici]MDN3241136.1 hypothetical protein [Glycomyces tritici]